MKIFTLCLLTLFITAAYSQNTWTNGNGTGVWNDELNWSSGVVPDGFENVLFDGTTGSNDNCVIDIDPGLTGIGFTMSTTYSGTVTVADGVTFECGLMTLQGGTLVMGDGSFSSAGFNMGGSSVTREFDGTNASQITISGNLSLGTALSTFRAAANTTNGTTLVGTLTPGTATFVHNSGKFRFAPASNKTIPNGMTFYQLELFNPISGSIMFTFGTAVSVTNALILSGNSSASHMSFATGTVNLSGDLNVSGFTSTTAGATLTGTINFTGTGTQSIIGNASAGMAKLPNITINKSGGSLSLGSDHISIAGNFTYTAGTVNAGTSTVSFYGTKNINSSGVTFNNVNIGNGSTATSTLTSAMRVAGNLNINSSSTLTTGNLGLTLEGDVTNLGTFTPGSSVITLAGGNAQALDFRNSTTPTLHTLVVNKSGGTATVNDNLIISDLLTSTSGTLNANGRITLQSNASKTAQVGPVSGTLSGNFIVQRFVPASTTPKWRFLTAPVTAASNANLRSNWQGDMFITGAGTGTGPVGLTNYNSNGFDWTLSNNASMYIYNESQTTDFNSRWTAIANPTTSTFTAGRGYRTYVRGDRSSAGRLDGSETSQNAVTLNVTGALATGEQTLNVTCTNGCTLNDGWNLLGNPFAATIDWLTVARTNVDATVYVYNPLQNLYCTYTSGGSGTNGGTQYISSGQGFFVKCNNSSGGNIVVEEGDKSPNNANDMYKTSTTANELRVLLNNTANTVKDEILVGYHHNASQAYDGETDAYKMGGGFGSISSTTSSLGTLLTVNKINPSVDFSVDTIILNVNLKGTPQTFSLNFSGLSSFEQGTIIYLHDKFLNTTVNVSTTPIYTFTTVADTNSYGKRFLVLLGYLAPLPVSYKNLYALNNRSNIDVQWTTASEYKLDGFDVERSSDGASFTKLGYVKATGSSTSEIAYNYVDESPLNGINYYRLKYINTNGNIGYSAILTVDFTKTGIGEIAATEKIKAYPVPATSELTLSLPESVKGDVKLTIVDPFGSLISSRIIPAGMGRELKQDVSGLQSGVYFAQIKTANGPATQVKFIKD